MSPLCYQRAECSRPGYEKIVCKHCGVFIGYKPIYAKQPKKMWAKEDEIKETTLFDEG